MARYVQEYCLMEAQDRVHLQLCHFLNQRGYTTQQYKGTTVFCKGNSVLGMDTMVQLTYPTGMVRVEAWMKTLPFPGYPDGEFPIEGYVGIAGKGELKSVVVELDKLLGGVQNRIGTHPYLAKKAAENAQPPLFSFQSSKPQQASEPVNRQWNVAEQLKEQIRSIQNPAPKAAPTPQNPPAPQPAPKPASQPAPQPVPQPVPQSAAPVDINRCTQSELMTLPGIGVVQAKKAMEYREQNGGFRSLDEFVEVLQIKPHFAVQIFSRAVVSQAERKPAAQSSHTTHTRRTIDF